MVDDLRDAGDGGGDRGQPDAQRLEQHRGKPVSVSRCAHDRGKHEHRRPLQRLEQPLLGMGSHEDHAVVQTQGADPFAQGRPLRPVANDQAPERALPVGEKPAGVDEVEESFLLHQPTDGEDQARLPLDRGIWPEPGQIDSVVEPEDLSGQGFAGHGS